MDKPEHQELQQQGSGHSVMRDSLAYREMALLTAESAGDE